MKEFQDAHWLWIFANLEGVFMWYLEDRNRKTKKRKDTRYYRNNQNLLIILLLVYTALCQSAISYCIAAWGSAAKTTILEIKRGQRSVLKVMLKRRFRYPTATLNAESHVLNGTKMVRICDFFENLYEEDIYVVLENCKMDDQSFKHHLHIWVGTGASELDVTHAERHAASLDVWMRRRASLHWERQDQECEQFYSYFNPVLQYQPGKYRDYEKERRRHGLTETLEDEVETEREKALFSVYVHRNMKKVKLVKCDMSSLNKRDPLILITGTDVYVLGRGSWNYEVLRGVANTISFRIRMENLQVDRHMDVIMLDNTAAIEDWDEFYKALGWTDTDSFPPIPDGIEDEVESQDAPQLYEIRRNRRGNIYYGSMPLERNALDTKSLYILTKGKDDVCLWIGKKNQDRNKAKLYGLAKLREFTSLQIPRSKWPPWQHMSIIPEGFEPLSFKRHFHNWIGQDS